MKLLCKFTDFHTQSCHNLASFPALPLLGGRGLETRLVVIRIFKTTNIILQLCKLVNTVPKHITNSICTTKKSSMLATTCSVWKTSHNNADYKCKPDVETNYKPKVYTFTIHVKYASRWL